MDGVQNCNAGFMFNRMSTLRIYESSGLEVLIIALYDALKGKPIGSDHFKNWLRCFSKGVIKEYLRFSVNPFQKTIDFYCPWVIGVIARISY